MPQTELERCRDMSDEDLLDTVRKHPLANHIPALTALLERVEVTPDTNPEKET